MPDYNTFGSGMPMTGTADPRTRMALALMQSGADTSPVRHWTQGLARVVQAMTGGMMAGQAQHESGQALSGLADALSAPQGAAAPEQSAPAAPTAPMVPPAAMSGTPMADQSPPMSGGIMTADNSATTGPVPRGFRNNNPLNIEAGSFTQGQPGFQGSDGRFAQFGSMDQGVGAADTLLQSYAKRGINTVAGVVNRWAPPSDNNPTNTYAATVAKAMGVDPNAPLNMADPGVRQGLISAMAKFENGKPLQMASAAPQTMTDASPMGAGPMGFAPQPQNANPLGDATQFAQNDQQPNVTTLNVKPTTPSIGNGAQSPQMKPILAPPGAAQPTMPANVKAAISAALASDNPQAQALAAGLLQKYAQPVEYGFQTMPDGTMVRTNKQTGSVEPISQTTKPQFNANAGRDQYGNPIPGFVDATNQSVHLIGPNGQVGNQPGQAPQPQGNPDVHGEEFLKTVDPQKAEIVKGIAEGRIPYPSGFVMKTPYGQWLTQAVSQYKPGLTAQDFNTIAATRKNYTSGPSFQEIKAINTAIGHASSLYGISDQLGGTDVAPGYLNPIIQGTKNNVPSIDPNFQTAKKNYDAISETLATEVSKAINGGVPLQADKEHWRSIFSNADGPTQRKAAISSAMKILEGRTVPLQQGYEQGMKSAGEPLNVISPENQQRFDRLLHGQSPTEGQPPAQQQPPANGPKLGEVQQGYRFKGGNPADQNAWEKVQ